MMQERIAPPQHDTLDGVPEPSENPRLVGHEAVKAALAGAYRSGKLPHALILAGPAGIGKATLAFHLAHHLLAHRIPAEAPQSFVDPDPTSPLFRQIASGAHPGVLHLTRPVNEKTKGFKTAVTVDEIRRIGRFLSLTSHDGGYRIVIIDPADDMNQNAANALLKNLEEPPSRTVFLLVVHSLGRLLPTIRSRCQVMRLQPLAAPQLAAALEAVGSPLAGANADAGLLERRSGGSVREAIMLVQHGGLEIAEALDAVVGSAAPEAAAMHRLSDAVAARDQGSAFELFNRRCLDLLAEAASAAARQGDVARAGRLSNAWQEARLATDEAQTYNLDRKQHALNMILSLNAALRM